MGYSCPVCSEPQADGVHLANHVAITALTRGGDHEAYLDEQVGEWRGLSEEELAELVVEQANEADYPQVFEDTTHDHSDDHRTDAESVPFETNMPDGDEDTDEVLQEARELTQKRRQNTTSADDEPETE